jgi:uncharacterized protein (TIGR03083 family)
MGLTNTECIDLAVAEIRRLADATEGVDPTTPVSTCPGWTIADLLQHTGEVNRWAALLVERVSQERISRQDMESDFPADPEDAPAWIAAGAAIVRRAFLAADPGAAMWAWGVPKLAGFWPRRMVHETGVHRADAELAVGRSPSFDPDVAADGIDELLDNIPAAASFAPHVDELRGDGEIIGLVATDDTALGWRIELLPDCFTWVRTPGAPDGADATVAMRAGDLLLALYGRLPAVAAGSQELWDFWKDHSAI